MQTDEDGLMNTECSAERARLREADEEPATGCVEELSRIVAQVRALSLIHI